MSRPVPRPVPAMRAVRPIAGAAARTGVVRVEPEAVRAIEALIERLVEHGFSPFIEDRAAIKRAAAFLARARRGGGRP